MPMNPLLAGMLSAREAQRKRYAGSPFATLAPQEVEGPTGDLSARPEGALSLLLDGLPEATQRDEASVEGLRTAESLTLALIHEVANSDTFGLPDPKQMNLGQRHLYKVRMAFNPLAKQEMQQRALALRGQLLTQAVGRLVDISAELRLQGETPATEATNEAIADAIKQVFGQEVNDLMVQQLVSAGIIRQEDADKAKALSRGVEIQSEAEKLAESSKRLETFTKLAKDGVPTELVADPAYAKIKAAIDKKAALEPTEDVKDALSFEQRLNDSVKTYLDAHTKSERRYVTDPVTKEPVLDRDGKPLRETVWLSTKTYDQALRAALTGYMVNPTLRPWAEARLKALDSEAPQVPGLRIEDVLEKIGASRDDESSD